MNDFKIGVTGHRNIPSSRPYRTAVRIVIQDIHALVSRKQSDTIMVLLSPLAEGADRIVAREWLQLPEFVLDCPLPLEADEYLSDFQTAASKREFRNLLAQSRATVVMAWQKDRSAAYKAVGHYVVEHCDVLLAIWDGRAPENESGTAAMVSYARVLEKPLYWIHAKCPHKIAKERLNKIWA